MDPLTVLVIADPADPRMRLLELAPPGVTFVVAAHAEELLTRAPHAEAVLCWWCGREELDRVLEGAPRLRWVHSAAAGLDRLISPTLAASSVTLTNSRGVFSRALAEFVLASVLFFAKDIPRMRRAQAAGRWEPFEVETLPGRTLGVVGYGDIGRAAASLAHAAGMRIVAMRRRPELLRGDPLVAEVAGSAREVCARAEYVVLAAPLTPETLHMIGPGELEAMGPRGVLINVGRGALVDEPALIEALRSGRIRGAALDVFETEPLPAGHPFYGMDNVLLSPHCADRTATWLDEAMRLFLDNLARYRVGEPLRNVVDKQRGY